MRASEEGIAIELFDGGYGAGDDRNAASHCFDGREAEAFGFRRKNEKRGAVEKQTLLFLGNEAGTVNEVAEAERFDLVREFSGVAASGFSAPFADEDEMEFGVAAVEKMKGIDEAVDIFVSFHGAEVDDVGLRNLEVGENGGNRAGVGLDEEVAGINGIGDESHLVRRNPVVAANIERAGSGGSDDGCRLACAPGEKPVEELAFCRGEQVAMSGVHGVVDMENCAGTSPEGGNTLHVNDVKTVAQIKEREPGEAAGPRGGGGLEAKVEVGGEFVGLKGMPFSEVEEKLMRGVFEGETANQSLDADLDSPFLFAEDGGVDSDT